MRRGGQRRTCASGGQSQSGMAILMVLGVIAMTALLTVHLMALSETIGKEAAVNAMMSRLRYRVESATDEALWMHLTDRRLFSNRTLGGSLEDREQTSDFEPWMLDGREHDMGDGCFVYLHDAVKSFSVDAVEKVKDNVDEEDTEGLEAADTFIDIYKDYTDTDGFLNLYGMEVDDYAAEGFPTLPRNDAMQFRAELFWLPNWRNVIQGDITIIPPKNITMGGRTRVIGGRQGSQGRQGQRGAGSGKPNFFTCSEEDIRTTLARQAMQISEAQIEEVIRARQQWQETGESLEDLLEGDLLITVKNYFSFEESGYAEITATASAYDGAVTVRRTVTREVNMNSQTIHSDQHKQTLSIWETRNY